MNGGSTNTGLSDPSWPNDGDTFADSETMRDEPHWLAEGQHESESDGLARRWWLPAVSFAVVGIWLIAMIAYAWPALGRLDAIRLTGFIASLCVPPALLGILWLLTQRTSQAEARRFAATARSMRAEAASLESAIARVQQALDTNRTELADQAASLVVLSDGAADRLRTINTGIAAQAHAIDTSASILARCAGDAEHRLAALLTSLPAAQAETEALSRRLDAIGASAAERVETLNATLSALVQRSHEADTVASGAADRLAAQMLRMDQIGNGAAARLEVAVAGVGDTIDSVLDKTTAAIDETRKAIAIQGEVTIAMLESNGAAIDRAGQDASQALFDHVTQIDAAVRELAQQLGQRRQEGEALLGTLEAGLAGVDARFDRLHAIGVERVQAVSASVAALTQVTDAMSDALTAGDATARRVIATAEEVLTALDAAAREMDETLPGALDRLDDRVGSSRNLIAQSKPELLALVTAAESTHDAIEAITGVVGMQRDTLATVQQSLLDTLDMGRDRIAGVRTIVDQTIATTVKFADDAAPRLVETLHRLRESVDQTSQHARDTLTRILPDTARELEAQSARALASAVDRSMTRQVAELSDLADAAVAATAAASERLAQQVRDITQNAATLDTSIATARVERDAADSDQLSRRVSLLIESMNSAAIDIGRSLSTDVSDTAWAAYLKGDRGVFTRRAVRLIDGTQARDIAQLYDADETFRDQVNRYIHDFEAMLRQILVLRDGSPMGVTLLSSDMGKLYVMLAQAIERLRN